LEADYNFFDCEKCGERYPFEIAAELNFVCSCGNSLTSANDPKNKRNRRKDQKYQKELVMLATMENKHKIVDKAAYFG